jgi:two-component system nitrate/nitrite response regulator NarL
VQTESKVTVAILEDERFSREILAKFLQGMDIEVVVSAGEPEEFLAQMRRTSATVAVLDVGLSSTDGFNLRDGLSVLRELRQSHPDTYSLILSANSSAEVIERCFREGAAGYLWKMTSDCEAIVNAIQTVLRGERIFPPKSMRAGATALGPTTSVTSDSPPLTDFLTPREREVLTYLAAGADNLKIAAHLHIAERTVKAHLTGLYRKSGCENRTQLALLARHLGIKPAPGV